MPARHVVVDGSNIATEGSSLPSLKQLDQAVREFLVENPDDIVTVVVDATFGHRIPPEERKRFEEAELDGDLVSPPAGAIGRGDAFLLRVADKVGAVVLSNDSFQEFHGEYEWLFDKGRLIGGKPVPGIGWIFTPRSPVRGPKSRESVKEAKRKRRTGPEAEESGLDMAAERSRGRGGERKLQRAIAVAVEEAVEPAKEGRKRHRRRRDGDVPAEPLNEPLNFISFIAAHQLGDQVEGTVEEFSSHGAFVSTDGARCYLPLAAMGEVPPRSARDVLRKGETRSFVVQAFDAMRRGIELALPGFARISGGPTPETVEAEIHRAEPVAVKALPAAKAPAAVKKATAAAKAPAAVKKATAAAKKAPAAAKKATAAAKKAPAAAKKAPAPAKKVPVSAKKAPAATAGVAPGKAPARGKAAPAEKVQAAKKTPPADKAAARKVTAATKTVPAPAKKPAVKKAAAAPAQPPSHGRAQPASPRKSAPAPTKAPTIKKAALGGKVAPAGTGSPQAGTASTQAGTASPQAGTGSPQKAPARPGPARNSKTAPVGKAAPGAAALVKKSARPSRSPGANPAAAPPAGPPAKKSSGRAGAAGPARGAGGARAVREPGASKRAPAVKGPGEDVPLAASARPSEAPAEPAAPRRRRARHTAPVEAPEVPAPTAPTGDGPPKRAASPRAAIKRLAARAASELSSRQVADASAAGGDGAKS